MSTRNEVVLDIETQNTFQDVGAYNPALLSHLNPVEKQIISRHEQHNRTNARYVNHDFFISLLAIEPLCHPTSHNPKTTVTFAKILDKPIPLVESIICTPFDYCFPDVQSYILSHAQLSI